MLNRWSRKQPDGGVPDCARKRPACPAFLLSGNRISGYGVILLFTDFGFADLYVGPVKAALWQHAPGACIVDILHEAPNYDVAAGAHLLAALAGHFPPGCVCLAVVDPGVGGERGAILLCADGRWYLGPDNGLLSVLAARAATISYWNIDWRPDALSPSFHGRDLFASVAASVELGMFPGAIPNQPAAMKVWLDAADLEQVIYLDHYGNAMTGIRAANLAHDQRVRMGDAVLPYARVFAEVAEGKAFWYENSIGLVEIAVNRGSARDVLGLRLGDPVLVEN